MQSRDLRLSVCLSFAVLPVVSCLCSASCSSEALLGLTSFLCSRSSARFNLARLLRDLPCMIANSLLRLKGGGGGEERTGG